LESWINVCSDYVFLKRPWEYRSYWDRPKVNRLCRFADLRHRCDNRRLPLLWYIAFCNRLIEWPRRPVHQAAKTTPVYCRDQRLLVGVCQACERLLLPWYRCIGLCSQLRCRLLVVPVSRNGGVMIIEHLRRNASSGHPYLFLVYFFVVQCMPNACPFIIITSLD